MDMKVDAKRIRDERTSRAWSQEHLAAITGLGLRTVQRIESSGGASHESIAAIASVLAVPVDQLIIIGTLRPSLADMLLAKRLWILAPLALLALLVAPPELQNQVLVLLALWVGFEALIGVVRWKNIQL